MGFNVSRLRKQRVSDWKAYVVAALSTGRPDFVRPHMVAPSIPMPLLPRDALEMDSRCSGMSGGLGAVGLMGDETFR